MWDALRRLLGRGPTDEAAPAPAGRLLERLSPAALEERVNVLVARQRAWTPSAPAPGGALASQRAAAARVAAALPPFDGALANRAWVREALVRLEEARRRYRESDDEDEAGWGSATFGEVVRALEELERAP